MSEKVFLNDYFRNIAAGASNMQHLFFRVLIAS